MTALIWPIVILGAVQLLLWTAAADLIGSLTASAPGPMPLTGDVHHL